MAGQWRVSITSTGAGKVEKITPASMGHRTPRLLGYDAYVYAGTTGAAVNLIISEGESSGQHTSSATVGTVGRATEMQPVRAYSRSGLAGLYVKDDRLLRFVEVPVMRVPVRPVPKRCRQGL